MNYPFLETNKDFNRSQEKNYTYFRAQFIQRIYKIQLPPEPFQLAPELIQLPSELLQLPPKMIKLPL